MSDNGSKALMSGLLTDQGFSTNLEVIIEPRLYRRQRKKLTNGHAVRQIEQCDESFHKIVESIGVDGIISMVMTIAGQPFGRCPSTGVKMLSILRPS